MSLICSHMDSKLPQSAISALIWASWMKSRSAAVCAYVCVRAKAREISQFLSTNLCKEHYCSPAVQKLKIKIWSSSATLSTVWTSSPGVTPDQLTSRSWVSFRRCLVWLVSLSKSVWIRGGGQGRQMLTDEVEQQQREEQRWGGVTQHCGGEQIIDAQQTTLLCSSRIPRHSYNGTVFPHVHHKHIVWVSARGQIFHLFGRRKSHMLHHTRRRSGPLTLLAPWASNTSIIHYYCRHRLMLL